MAINNPFKLTDFHQRSGTHSTIKLFVLITLLLFLLLGISGCVTLADPEASQEYSSDPVGVLEGQTSLGQSFVSRRPNLNGVTIWITTSLKQSNETASNNVNSINVKLYKDPKDLSPIFASNIIAPLSANNVPLTISIPDQKDSGGQIYYLGLTKASGTIQINGRTEDAYPLGQAFIDEKAISADIAFRLSYNYDFNALLQDIKQSIGFLWIILPLLVVLWLPGWLLLELSGFRSRFDFGEQTAISTGLSLALIPVVMLWTTILKIKWTSRGLFFTAGFLLAIFIARLVYIGFTSLRNLRKLENSQSRDLPTLPDKIFAFFSGKSFVLILIFLGSLAVRLIMVRDLATPAWVDSVHHALITRLILENGSFPATYLPFWDINPAAYHPGFHSIAATFTCLSNLDLSHSLLFLGQVLNALSVFSVYLFTTSLTHSSKAGLFAALITGFLTPMPAYYTSWGRYTELSGLLCLPVILAITQLCMGEKTPKRCSWIILLGGITAGGLFMIHYRVIVFLAGLIISYLIFYFVGKREDFQIKPGRFLAYVIAIAVLGIASVFPWILQTLKSTVLPMVNTPITTSVPFFQDFSWSYLTSALGKQSLVLAGLGLLWGMIKLRKFTFILILWIVILFFLGNMASLRIYGGGLISTSSVEIMLFIPISIFGGYFIDQILVSWKDLIPKQLIRPSLIFLLFLSGVIAFLGAKQLVGILNPITILSRNADLPAIKWVSEHIPQNETIVINPFAWGYGLYGGGDGGFWISPLSGRVTLPPPVLYGLGSESNKIIQQSQQVITLSPDPSAFWEFLNSQRLNYVYVGAKGGVIPPEKLASSGLFTLIYHQDGVWIFSVKP